MYNATTTIGDLVQHKPCSGGLRRLLSGLGLKKAKGNEHVKFTMIDYKRLLLGIEVSTIRVDG